MIEPIWKVPMTLDYVNQRSEGTLLTHVGIEFIEFGDNYLVGRMPVDHRTKQPIGIMHGGSSCVLAETVGSTAANCAVDPNTHYCVGLSINTNHIRAIGAGWVIATATPLHLGRSTQVWEIPIKDEQNRLISTTRLTLSVLDK